jgi:predicted RNase H-like HicB family nuclease
MTMTTATNLPSTVSQILSSIGLGHVGVQHDDGVTWVTDTILPVADARRAVEALRAAGYVADDARDALAAGFWVYVSPDLVAVRAYVDDAGDLMVELPEQRGCVEVRAATLEEAQESAGMTEGWITTHVARHLLVAVGFLPAEA